MPDIPGVGPDSYLQLAAEATYGVAPAAATAKYELISENIVPVLSVIEDPSMTNTQVSRRFIGQGPQIVQGPVRIRTNYVGMEEIIRAALPTYAFAAGSKQHSFREGSTAAPLKSYAIDVSKGNIPATKVNRVLGAFIPNIKFSGQAAAGEGGMVMCDLDVIGVSIAGNTTPMTAATLPSAQPVIYHQAVTAQLQDGSGATPANMIIRAFEVALTQAHDLQRFYLGAVNAKRPVRNGPMEVNWSFTEEWTDYLLMQAAANNTPTGPLRVQFKQAANFDGTNFRTLTLQSSSFVPSEFSAPIDGWGVILQTVGYRAFYNATDLSALLVQTISEQAQLAA